MTPEENKMAVARAAAETTPVFVNGFSVAVPMDSRMVRLSGVEQVGDDTRVYGRGAWIMTPQKAEELHGLLGQLLDLLRKATQ